MTKILKLLLLFALKINSKVSPHANQINSCILFASVFQASRTRVIFYIKAALF